MANKYSRNNVSTKAREQKTMQDYHKSRDRLNKGARIIAIIMIAAMVITFTIMSGLFALN